MRVIGKACCLLALMLLVPRLAHAQASITGTVKDGSGALSQRDHGGLPVRPRH